MALDLKRAGEAEDPRVVDDVGVGEPPGVEGVGLLGVESWERLTHVTQRPLSIVDDLPAVAHADFLAVNTSVSWSRVAGSSV